jgi:hypothetical protein
VLFTCVEKIMDSLDMQCSSFLMIAGCYPPVIHILVCILPILLQEGCKILSHHSLKEGRCIAYPKIHYFRDVHPIACLYCCFVLILIGKLYVIIAMVYVEF